MNERSNFSGRIDAHYGVGGLCEKILDALEKDGKDLDRLAPEDLAPVDQFHIGGMDATLAFATWSGLKDGCRVLDVGCGIGGPARILAARFGCRVTGVDVTEEYCRTARRLTELVDLSERVDFECRDALEIPWNDRSFDVVWAQHVAMNVPDKLAYFRGIRKALNNGERFVFYEIMAGSKEPIHFPVPWAGSPELSFLVTPGEWRNLLSKAGYRVLGWEDVTASAIDWFEQRMTEKEDPDFSMPEARLQLLFGDDADRKFGNVFRNLREERITVVRGSAAVQ